MPPAPEGGVSLQGQIPDHLAVGAGHQSIHALRLLGETLAPHLRRREGKLQGALDHPRAAKDPVQRFIVIWLGVTDGYVHGRLSSERERRST